MLFFPLAKPKKVQITLQSFPTCDHKKINSSNGRERVTEISPRRPGGDFKKCRYETRKLRENRKKSYTMASCLLQKSSLLNYTVRKHTAKRQRERERENTRAHPGDLSVPSELLKRTRANFLRIPRNKSIIGRRSAREREREREQNASLGIIFLRR